MSAFGITFGKYSLAESSINTGRRDGSGSLKNPFLFFKFLLWNIICLWTYNMKVGGERR